MSVLSNIFRAIYQPLTNTPHCVRLTDDIEENILNIKKSLQIALCIKLYADFGCTGPHNIYNSIAKEHLEGIHSYTQCAKGEITTKKRFTEVVKSYQHDRRRRNVENKSETPRRRGRPRKSTTTSCPTTITIDPTTTAPTTIQKAEPAETMTPQDFEVTTPSEDQLNKARLAQLKAKLLEQLNRLKDMPEIRHGGIIIGKPPPPEVIESMKMRVHKIQIVPPKMQAISPSTTTTTTTTTIPTPEIPISTTHQAHNEIFRFTSRPSVEGIKLGINNTLQERFVKQKYLIVNFTNPENLTHPRYVFKMPLPNVTISYLVGKLRKLEYYFWDKFFENFEPSMKDDFDFQVPSWKDEWRYIDWTFFTRMSPTQFGVSVLPIEVLLVDLRNFFREVKDKKDKLPYGEKIFSMFEIITKACADIVRYHQAWAVKTAHLPKTINQRQQDAECALWAKVLGQILVTGIALGVKYNSTLIT